MDVRYNKMEFIKEMFRQIRSHILPSAPQSKLIYLSKSFRLKHLPSSCHGQPCASVAAKAPVLANILLSPR